MKRSLEELNVMDDFLINAIASDREVGIPFCRVVLSVLLQRKIGRIKIISQRTIPAPAPGLRGIRMDVEILEAAANLEGEEEILNIYDLEPHLRKEVDFARHNRFYQAKIDSRYMNSGENDFSRLPNLYILTITDFDPFGYDYMMYTIQNKCVEIPSMEYNDGLQFVYFYTKGTRGGNPEIQAVLKYFTDSRPENVTNETIREIHNYVSRIKILPEVRQEYMMFEDFLYYERKEVAERAAEQAVLQSKVEVILDFLQELGPVPKEVLEKLEGEKNPEKLRQWCRIAGKVSSIEEFRNRIEE